MTPDAHVAHDVLSDPERTDLLLSGAPLDDAADPGGPPTRSAGHAPVPLPEHIGRLRVLREIARGYPGQLLLVETDTYPLPNRNTEPAHVVSVAQTLALTRGWTFEQTRTQLAANTRSAFKILDRGP